MSERRYHAVDPRHTEAVRRAVAGNDETRAHAETLAKLYGMREQRDKLKAKVDALETEVTYLKAVAEHKEISHPVKHGTRWACSVCGAWVNLSHDKPRYPRCPYCGVRYSGTWAYERREIERQEHERQANRP